MKFLGKIFSILIVLFTVYIICIFLAPATADSIGKDLGILSFNIWIRELKGGADSVSDDLLQVKSAGNILDSARDAAAKTTDLIQKTQEGISNTRQVIETKVQQVNKVADSIEKTRNAANELQKNIGDLTTFNTGTTSTGSYDSGLAH